MVWERVGEADQHVSCSSSGLFGAGRTYPAALEIPAVSALLLDFPAFCEKLFGDDDTPLRLQRIVGVI
jgi:hypothetical protein